jgi:hypothetical protein
VILLKLIDLSKYQQIDLAPESNQILSFTVWPSGEIRLNSKLAGLLGGKSVLLYSSDDAKELLLDETEKEEEKSRLIPKSAKFKSERLKSFLYRKKVSLPVCYMVEWDEKCEVWRCKLDCSFQNNPKYVPDFTSDAPPSVQKKTRKPRTKGLKDMLP